MQYMLGLGSNLSPEKNLPAALIKLLEHSPILLISSVLITQPQNLVSPHQFLNMAVVWQSRRDPLEAKSLFNQIETELGRDRNDPQRKTKDRTIDIDILFSFSEALDIQEEIWPSEPYLLPQVTQLVDLLTNRNNPPELPFQPAPLNLGGHVIGLHPMSLSASAKFNANSGRGIIATKETID